MRVTFLMTLQGRQTNGRIYKAGETAEIEDIAAHDLLCRGLVVVPEDPEVHRPTRKKKEAPCELP